MQVGDNLSLYSQQGAAKAYLSLPRYHGGMLPLQLITVICITSVGETTGFNIGAALWRSTTKVDVPCRTTSRTLINPTRAPKVLSWRNPTDAERSPRSPKLERGCSRLQRLLGDRRRPRPQLRNRNDTKPGQSAVGCDANARRLDTDPELVIANSGAVVALPILSRLFAQASNLFQVGVLLGTIPTILAAGVCCYWAWQVLIAGSRDYQERKTAEGIKMCRLPAAKVGPGRPGFVDRPKLFDADALRLEVESRYNPTLLVYGERGSGKTVAVRLALHATPCVVHVKLWGPDLDAPLKALAKAIVDASGADVTLTPALVAEAALRRLKGKGWGVGGALAPIVVVELDKRCTASQLQGVLLACKRWGDDENLAKFVVEAPSARIARGLPISLADLRVEGIKMPLLAPKEARQVARGCVPIAAARDWTGGRREDLARVVVAKVGFGMLDLVRVGFAAQNTRDPLAFHSAVDSFASREARAARGGVTAFLNALSADGRICEPDNLDRRLWKAVEGAAAVVEGGTGRNPGLDEVLEELGVSEKDFERAAGGVGPVCPVAVDPFSYKVVVRSVHFKDALATFAVDDEEVEETNLEHSVLSVERSFAAGVPRNS